MKRNRLSFKRDLDCRGTIDRSLVENNSIFSCFLRSSMVYYLCLYLLRMDVDSSKAH